MVIDTLPREVGILDLEDGDLLPFAAGKATCNLNLRRLGEQTHNLTDILWRPEDGTTFLLECGLNATLR